MPKTEVRAFRDDFGKEAAICEWLDELEQREPDAYAKCLDRVLQLAKMGNQMRRPQADMLRSGIYELRTKVRRVNYRVFYFFIGKNEAMLSHGNTKEGKVEEGDIELAIKRKKLVQANPQRHTAEFDI